MNSAAIYEYILSRMQSELAEHGYSRSGKGALFYKFSADKRVACCIQMQRSINNSPESYSFTFNILCVGLYDIDGYFNDRLTISTLKTCLQNPFLSERIGILCRGGDYWWEITDKILHKFNLEKYYDNFIKKDIDKSVVYLNDLALKKTQLYT